MENTRTKFVKLVLVCIVCLGSISGLALLIQTLIN